MRPTSANHGMTRHRAQESAGTVRVAILSDTHGYVCPNVMAVVQTCDLAVHAGDIGSSKVLDLLESATGEVHAVRGNNDVLARSSDQYHRYARPH